MDNNITLTDFHFLQTYSPDMFRFGIREDENHSFFNTVEVNTPSKENFKCVLLLDDSTVFFNKYLSLRLTSFYEEFRNCKSNSFLDKLTCHQFLTMLFHERKQNNSRNNQHILIVFYYEGMDIEDVIEKTQHVYERIPHRGGYLIVKVRQYEEQKEQKEYQKEEELNDLFPQAKRQKMFEFDF